MAIAALAMYVVMVFVVFVLRSAIQKRSTGDSGIRAGVLSSATGSIDWVAGWLLVFAMVAGLAAPTVEIAGLEPITNNPWIRVAGSVVAATGVVLTFIAQLSMGSEWRVGIDPQERTNLVREGAFGVVRNPVFAAMILAGVGFALMVPNEISIIGSVVLFVAIELQVRFVEEPHLRTLHGDDYLSYSSRVGRFVPGVGLN